MKKSLVRTLIFGGVVAALFGLSFVSYGIARDIKGDFSDTTVEKLTQEDNLKTAREDGDDEEVARLEKLIQDLENKLKSYDTSYHVFSIGAYTLTIGSLAAFGICLAISDKIKVKEEEEAAKS